MSSYASYSKFRRFIRGHQNAATPALLEAAIHQLAALVQPLALMNVLQLVQKFPRLDFLRGVHDPNSRQASRRRQFSRCARQVLPLNVGVNASGCEGIRPQRHQHQVGASGVKWWEDAVLNAIDKTETLHPDVDHCVNPALTLVFNPND